MKTLLALALASASLSACTHPNTAATIAKADSALTKAEAGYAVARSYAEMLVPFLSDARVAQIRALETRIEGLLSKARAAVTLAEQLAVLEEVEKATLELVAH